MFGILASIMDGLEFTAEHIFIPVLAPGRDGFQIFGVKLLLTILEIEEDLAIVLTKAPNHGHDLEGLAERVSRHVKFVK